MAETGTVATYGEIGITIAFIGGIMFVMSMLFSALGAIEGNTSLDTGSPVYVDPSVYTKFLDISPIVFIAMMLVGAVIYAFSEA